MSELITAFQELIYVMFAVIDEGVFDDSAQTEQIGFEAIERANQTLIAYGAEPVTYEMWKERVTNG